jgi:BirA family biotin operon repressor/biotin-[acetyl-CoA-carboxylase] ligase
MGSRVVGDVVPERAEAEPSWTSVRAVNASARPWPTGGWRVSFLSEVDSTNRLLLDAARDGADAGLVVVADHQSAGRGRRGRRWDAAPGTSLLVSVLVRPRLPAARAHLLATAAALALGDAVTRVCGVVARLKWPNDLVVRDRKLAGILAESIVADGQIEAIVLGAGCNVECDELPAALADIATSCELESGHPVDRDALLHAYLEELPRHLEALDRVTQHARARLDTLGRRVRVETDHGALVGIAVDLDDLGELVVRDDTGETHAIRTGDISNLRPA